MENVVSACGAHQDRNEHKIPQQPDQDGHVDQKAEIEILCVKHTLLVVSKAAVHRVKLGAKEIDGFKLAWAQLWAAKNNLERFAAISSTLKKSLVFYGALGFVKGIPTCQQ